MAGPSEEMKKIKKFVPEIERALSDIWGINPPPKEKQKLAQIILEVLFEKFSTSIDEKEEAEDPASVFLSLTPYILERIYELETFNEIAV